MKKLKNPVFLKLDMRDLVLNSFVSKFKLFTFSNTRIISCFEDQVECQPLVNTFEHYCKPFTSMFLCQGDCGRVKTDFFISKRLYTKQFIRTAHAVIS